MDVEVKLIAEPEELIAWLFQYYQETKAEDLQIKAAADMGALIFDGLCDGIFLYNHQL